MLAKKRLQNGVEQFRRQFGDQPTKALGAVLPSEVLQSLVTEEAGSFRERIYPPLTTLGLFIGQAMSADGACQDAVARRVSERCARGQAASRGACFTSQPLGKKRPPQVPSDRHPEPGSRVAAFLPLQAHPKKGEHNSGFVGPQPMPISIGSRNLWS